MCSISDLKADLFEYRKLAGQASRNAVKQTLQQNIDRIEMLLKEMIKIENVTNNDTSKPTLIEKRILSYGWDQSDSQVTIYLSDFPDNTLSELKADQIKLKHNERFIEVTILHEKSNTSFKFSVNKLLHSIESPSVKVKSAHVVICLKKKQAKTNWEYLTEADRLAKEKSKPKLDPVDDKKDPGDGLMDMMRKMYDEGDDEMKRTIAKAWTESREKQMSAN
ncbi:hypothetical protein GJ496_005952 [Pomphorhynchus laevis]|nr:hypothetical protein GJ496_005952 [Pomphorhynchus laevis]